MSGDSFVATANSKGLFEDLDDVPIWTCQGTSCKLPTEIILTSYPHQASSVAKRGGKGKGKQGLGAGTVGPTIQHKLLTISQGLVKSPLPGVVAQETRSDHVPSGTSDPIATDREFTKKRLIVEQPWEWMGKGV